MQALRHGSIPMALFVDAPMAYLCVFIGVGTRLRFKQAKSKKPHHAAKKIPSLKNRIRALDRFLKRGVRSTAGVFDCTRLWCVCVG
jgi:hypothetical protein